MSPPLPSWLLLAWAGGAATAAAAVTASLLGGRSHVPWALVPRPGSALKALTGTLLVGLVVYPAVYGLIFETLGRADLTVGAAGGVLHAIVAGLAGGPRRDPRQAGRLAAAHLVYAVVLGFLYVTP